MITNTHTHANTRKKTKVAQATGTKHSSGTHLDWVMTSKNRGSLQSKKKSVKEFSCYLLYRFFWDDFMDFWIWKKLMLRQLSNACTCRSIYWTSTTSTATSGCRAMYRNCVKIKHKIKCWVSIIQQEKAILIDPLSDLRLLELITKIFVMFQYNTTMLFYIVNNI